MSNEIYILIAILLIIGLLWKAIAGLFELFEYLVAVLFKIKDFFKKPPAALPKTRRIRRPISETQIIKPETLEKPAETSLDKSNFEEPTIMMYDTYGHVDFKKTRRMSRNYTINAKDPVTQKIKNIEKKKFKERTAKFYGKKGELDLD